MFRTIRARVNLTCVLFIAGLALLRASPALADDIATPDDTARFLAGLQPSAASPLSPLTRQPAWQQHARLFDAAWKRLEERQLQFIRAWSSQHLKGPQPVLFYMFSGPDFLHAEAFFPKASSYVMSGLEPAGPIPDIVKIAPGSVAGELARLRASLNAVLSYGFFITKNMRSQLNAGRLNGTLPVLYVFLARSGKTIHDVSLVAIDGDGNLTGHDQRSSAKGVRITFSGNDGRKQTLYYFSTDLSDEGTQNGSFLKFCVMQGRGDSLVKSASYLMHSDGFSRVRSFLLEHSATIVQDDSGIPISYFKPQDWQIRAFGSYPGPISIFRNRYQAKLRQLYQTSSSGALPFGFGYRWRPRESNLLLAVRANARSVSSQ